MFPNLEAEMARSKITQAKLADILDVTPTTMSFKLSGRSSLSLRECVEIKRKDFPDKTLDYLLHLFIHICLALYIIVFVHCIFPIDYIDKC